MILSLSRRVTRRAILSLVVLAIGYAGFSYTMVHGVLLHEVDETSEKIARPLKRALQAPGSGSRELDNALAEYPLWPGEHVSVRDAAGRVLGTRGPAPLPDGILEPGARELPDDPRLRLIVTPVIGDGQVRGQIVQVRQLEDFWHTLEHILFGLVALVPLTLLLAVALALWLAELASRPMEAALNRERQFSRDASHELRTPLSLILANTQLLLQRTDLAPDAREKLAHIEGRARRIKAVLRDLLTLGRGDGGHGEAPLRFAIGEVLEEEVATLAPLAAERSVTLDVDGASHEADVVGSPHGVAQALHNLLENAVRYTPRGSRVVVRLSVTATQARVTVTNPGPGIGPEDQARVFERFVRLEYGREANPDGSGLGLAIAQSIARAHRGELSLASHPDKGTSFMLALPLA